MDFGKGSHFMTRPEDVEQGLPVEYRDIPGHAGYRIGSDGTVWTAKKMIGQGKSRRAIITDRFRQMRTFVVNGYMVVNFREVRSDGGKGKLYQRKIHRILLECFVGPAPAGMVTRHLDDNRLNNGLTNLSWGTRAQNSQDAIRNGKICPPERKRNTKLDPDKVRRIRQMLSIGNRLVDIAAQFGVTPECIGAIASGRTWKNIS